MPDSDSSPPSQAVTRPPDYGLAAPPATPALRALLRDRIEREGPLDFSEFMATALYDPALGYYARDTRQVGRGGDFFTSVSVGPLFGGLLARRFLRQWEESGAPARWRILECGAHDGTLAHDILDALRRLSPDAFAALEYAIPEPLPRLQAAQRRTLVDYVEKMRFTTAATELFADPLPGVVFGNELLDALPFHLVEWQAGGWRECRVAIDAHANFVWDTSAPCDCEALDGLGKNFPEGYRTEVRTHFGSLFETLLGGFSSGLLVWLDYGFARPEFYHPDRRAGTLRTFSKHRAAENPLAAPGEMDITAHVDFTAVAEAAIALGCRPLVFQNQGAWLTSVGREWLLSQEGEPDAAALRQFQTLTHPAHLGGSFHILELAWQQSSPPSSPEVFHRLALPAIAR